jgi:CheY-like chemotaxis protein
VARILNRLVGIVLKQRWMRKRAVGLIVQIGMPAVEPLIAILKDKNRDVREAATEALIQIGSPAVMPLIAALGDRDIDKRAAAAKALGAIGDAAAFRPLIMALRDEDSDVRRLAAGALERLGLVPLGNTARADYLVAKQNLDQFAVLGTSVIQKYQEKHGNILVLVIEDDKIMVQMIAEILDGFGFEVATASHGRMAFKKLQQHPVNIIILDLLLPEMSGFEIYSRLQANPDTKDIPVLIASAWADERHIREASQMGIRHFLPKPFTEDDLLYELLDILWSVELGIY